ncbi:MAG: hypothetical protein CM15mP51_19170 [Porticoccaceae bacterium]|nr:MAG: hypothetical protein CM15mP51_19170 [Porticoccaceae bacterium]
MQKNKRKKESLLAREQEIVESAKSLLIDHHVDKITVAEIAKKSINRKGHHLQTLPNKKRNISEDNVRL